MKPFKARVSGFMSALQSGKSVLRILKRSSLSDRLSYRKGTGGACVVIGNGPSLNLDFESNPGFFSNRPCFCVNSFALTDKFLVARPSHYVLLDPAYYVKQTSKNLLELRESVFAAIREKLTWPMTLILPQEARSALKGHPITGLPNLAIIYFNTTTIYGYPAFKHAAFRANLGMPWAGTVLVGSVFAALNLGYKRVYLFGADHTWHENLHLTADNVLCLKDKHFYSSAEPAPSPFFEDAAEQYVFTMSSVFQRLSDIFKGYEDLKAYALHLGAETYNLGTGSFVDSFARLTMAQAEALDREA
jgi:hypothetical protein